MKKTVMVTGASSGFGEACARKYRGSGYRLILSARCFTALDIVEIVYLVTSLPPYINRMEV